MIEPKYSVLFCNQNLQEYMVQIGEWLKKGIKVFWFGTKEEAHILRTEYQPFVSALFLQVFEICISDKVIVIDGLQKDNSIQVLERNRPEFNAAQYQVEHCNAESHIIVEASAGTGKTTVMIDRIMYLIHTLQNLKLSELYMITFTNDATNQMNARLQEMLLKKYQLTGNRRYLEWLEEQSQMNISTIDSFAYSLLKEYGIEAGFSNNIGIHTFNYERKEVIKDEIDELINSNKSVSSQMGMSLYKGNATLDAYWRKFAQLGFSREEIISMNWGNGIDGASSKFQKVMTSVFDELDEDYLELKQRNNAVSLNDILRDLSEILNKTESNLSDLKIKYLFVDEFQDSDNSQIKVLTWLVRQLNCNLFVVGDIKQSIYRFRGATDTAFDTLEKGIQSIGAKFPVRYTLVNNYRTASNVLKGMDEYFKQWGADGILVYKKSVIPFNKEQGTMKMLSSAGSYSLEEQFCNVANSALRECGKRIARKDKEPTEKDKVVVLARTNRQLMNLAVICQKNHIPAIVKKEGSFYLSEAVRDFYAMISSFVFSDEPKYLFNYLMTPYAGIEDCLDINAFEEMNGDKVKLFDYMEQLLNHTEWKLYEKALRLEPVMSVVKNMLDKKDLLEKFVACKKRILLDAGWTEERCNIFVFYETKQYKANLDKLIEILQRNIGGEFTSLYDIYNFLKISIETNREEQEAEVEDNESYKCLNCMTVHKAKGLEFDTVIIPFTDFPFYYNGGTEVLVNNANSKIGWNYYDKNTDISLQNSFYEEIREEEDSNATQEETRILYVAMTRAINTLICLVAPDKKENTWAHLIREVGIDYE